MNISLTTIKKAYKLFSHTSVDKSIVRHNVRNWLRSMTILGDNHILAKQIQRKAH